MNCGARKNQKTPRSYVELHARSAFSFLRGASFPEHLAEQAAEAGVARRRAV